MLESSREPGKERDMSKAREDFHAALHSESVQARLLVIERGEQELRELFRDLAHTMVKRDEATQSKLDDIASEVRRSIGDLTQKLTDTQKEDLARLDEKGARLWGPALAVAGMLLTLMTVIGSGVSFYADQRFGFLEADVAENRTNDERQTGDIAELHRTGERLTALQTQINMDRDYQYRLGQASKGAPDPGPRFFTQAPSFIDNVSEHAPTDK